MELAELLEAVAVPHTVAAEGERRRAQLEMAGARCMAAVEEEDMPVAVERPRMVELEQMETHQVVLQAHSSILPMPPAEVPLRGTVRLVRSRSHGIDSVSREVHTRIKGAVQ